MPSSLSSVPYTMTHMPVLPHPEFKGASTNGDFADVLVQTDAYVGRLMETVERLGIADDTIFIFTSDNGPDPTTPHQSFSGPWSGSYFTGKEGSLRVPFIVRWPGKIPASAVSNEIVHQMDLFPTIARIVGGRVPDDRIINGIDQLDFFRGEQEASNREAVIVYVGNEIYGVKWRNFKMMSKEIDSARKPHHTHNGITTGGFVGQRASIWCAISDPCRPNRLFDQGPRILTCRTVNDGDDRAGCKPSRSNAVLVACKRLRLLPDARRATLAQ